MPSNLDHRIQQLMIDVGLPDSRSLYQAFKQLEMEVRLDERGLLPPHIVRGHPTSLDDSQLSLGLARAPD